MTIKERAKEAAIKEFGEVARLYDAGNYMLGYIKGATDQREIDEKELSPKWISVKDRLPENNEDVLLYCDKNKGIYYIGFCNVDEWMCECNVMELDTFTHWMPLPEAPTKNP